MSKHIFIAAHARSGSTYLCQILSLFDDLKVYYELFHYNLASIENYWADEYGKVSSFLEGKIGRPALRNDYV